MFNASHPHSVVFRSSTSACTHIDKFAAPRLHWTPSLWWWMPQKCRTRCYEDSVLVASMYGAAARPPPCACPSRLGHADTINTHLISKSVFAFERMNMLEELIGVLQKRWLEIIHRGNFCTWWCNIPLDFQVVWFSPWWDRRLRDLPAKDAAMKLFENVFKHLATSKELKLAKKLLDMMYSQPLSACYACEGWDSIVPIVCCSTHLSSSEDDTFQCSIIYHSATSITVSHSSVSPDFHRIIKISKTEQPWRFLLNTSSDWHAKRLALKSISSKLLMCDSYKGTEGSIGADAQKHCKVEHLVLLHRSAAEIFQEVLGSVRQFQAWAEEDRFLLLNKFVIYNRDLPWVLQINVNNINNSATLYIKYGQRRELQILTLLGDLWSHETLQASWIAQTCHTRSFYCTEYLCIMFWVLTEPQQ